MCVLPVSLHFEQKSSCVRCSVDQARAILDWFFRFISLFFLPLSLFFFSYSAGFHQWQSRQVGHARIFDDHAEDHAGMVSCVKRAAWWTTALSLYLISADRSPLFFMAFYPTIIHREMVDEIYPRFYSLHDLPPQIGVRDERNRVPMPPMLQLSAEKLARHGMFLICNGQDLVIFLGELLDQQLLMDVFNVEHAEELAPEIVCSAG